jgi:hypothetical protein
VPTYCAGPRILAPSEEWPILKIGFTGHQKRDGADWNWVAVELTRILSKLDLPFEGWSSLAIGADQVFARCVLGRGGILVSVIPLRDYEMLFQGQQNKEQYHRLLAASARIVELDNPDSNKAFFAAGARIVDQCTWMIAVWDGKPSQDFGGTADVVAYAEAHNRSVLVLDPITRSISRGAGLPI